MEGDGDLKRWRTREMGPGRDGGQEGRGPGGMGTRGRLGGCPGSPTAQAGRGRGARCRRRELGPGQAPQHTWGFSPTLPRRNLLQARDWGSASSRLRGAGPRGYSRRGSLRPRAPPYTPGAPRLSEGGDVTGGGAWGAGGKGVRARGPRVAARAGSRPSSLLFVEPPRPQIPVPLQTRILLIATPPKPCSVTPFPCTWICLQMPRKPAAGVRAPTFPVTPTSSLPPVNPLTVTSLGCLPACLGFPHPSFISPARARRAPSTKSVLDAPGETSELSQSRTGTWGPKTMLQNEGDPEGIRLGEYSSVPIFLHRDSGFWLLCPPLGCGEPAVCFVRASLGPSS